MSVYKRGNVWWIKIQSAGQVVRRTSGSTVRSEALEYERTLRQELGRIRRGGRPTRYYHEAMARWIKEHLPTIKPGSQRRYLTSARALQPIFRDVALQDIGRSLLADFVSTRRRAGVSGSGVRRDLACLSSMMTAAVAWDWIDHNPVKDYSKKQIRESRPRVRFLDPQEYDALLYFAASHLAPLIRLAVDTGLRFEEQFGLTWQQVDLTRGEIRLPETKSGEPRVVPLSPWARAQLRAQPRHLTCPYVFWHGDGRRYTTIKTALKTALRHSKIENFRWHDLRHTFAAWAVQGRHPWQAAPMPLNRLQRWLGHATPAMTNRYAHLTTDDLHAEMKGTETGT